jgi:hypothetical protein
MLLLLQIIIIQHQIYLLSTYNLSLHFNQFIFFSLFSIISRDCQTTNVGSAQTIMLTNSPNSIILTGQQQQPQQTINRNLIEQEPILYTTTTNAGRNELFYEPTSAKQTRLWQ